MTNSNPAGTFDSPIRDSTNRRIALKNQGLPLWSAGLVFVEGEPVFLMIAIAASLAHASGTPIETNGQVNLDGTVTPVNWDDGDTFKVAATGSSARLDGYNTLESYGAVHRFGPGEGALLKIAQAATEMAKSQVWKCSTQPGSGGYGRIRVSCPDLTHALLEAGLAHVFSVGSAAPADLLASQQKAINGQKGMWKGGAPKGIVTSVHSLDEKPDQTETYNRVVDPTTGQGTKRPHTETHKACAWVCQEGSCLLYVPYTQRYGEGRAACLK